MVEKRRSPAPRVLLMVVLAASTTAALPGTASADDWFGRDKALHFALSYAFGAGGYGLLWALRDDRPWVRLAVSAPAAVLPGVAKEIYDATRPGNYFSGRDLVWDVLGAVAGSLTLFIIDAALRDDVGGSARAGITHRGALVTVDF